MPGGGVRGHRAGQQRAETTGPLREVPHGLGTVERESMLQHPVDQCPAPPRDDGPEEQDAHRRIQLRAGAVPQGQVNPGCRPAESRPDGRCHRARQPPEPGNQGHGNQDR